MGGVLHFTYLYLYIYTLLVIYESPGTLAVKVSINQNITGFIGKTDIPLTCSFTNEAKEQTLSVQFFFKNETNDFDFKNPIAIFEPDKQPKLLPAGNNLIGRVTLTNITSTSTNATLTFHVLQCEDEKDYMCQCYNKYVHGGHLPPENSPLTRISIQATSSKPDHISSIIVATTRTAMQGYSSSSTKQYDILTTPASPIDTMASTQSTAKLPFVFNEGDTVMLTCTGDIGNPPGKLIWQKTFPMETKPVTYSNETTYIEEIPGKCSFKGASHLTVKVFAEDIKAKIRCFEESQVDILGMYLETEAFDVHFSVKHVDINKQPNQKQYGTQTDKITLSCKGRGNPEPTYIWFKEGNNNSILSNTSVFVITNVIQNNTGVYICEAYNIIGDIHYRESNSVEIDIVVDDLPSSQESDWWKFVKEYRTYFICGVVGVGIVAICVIIWCCCFRRKRQKNKARCSQKTKSDGITLNTEYATVIRKNIATSGETGDSMLVLNGMDRNKDKSRNKQEDLVKTLDVTTSYHINEYAVPSDALQVGTHTCKIGPGFTSFKDVKDI